MAVREMSKIAIFGSLSSKTRIIDVLHSFGAVQIESQNKDADYIDNDLEYSLSRMDASIDFLSSYYDENKGKNFWQKMKLNKFQKITNDSFKKLVDKVNPNEFIERCENLREKIVYHKNMASEAKKKVENLEDWKNLPFAPGWKSASAEIIFGYLNNKDLEFVKSKIIKLRYCDIQTLRIGEKRTNIYIVYHKNLRKNIKSLFAEFDFEEAEVIIEKESIVQEIKELEKVILENNNIVESLEQESKDLAVKKLKKLKIERDIIFWKKEKAETSVSKVKTAKFYFSLYAWLAKDNLEELKKEIINMDGVYLEELEFAPDDSVPVELKNNKFIEPLEAVTGMFGLPKYTEPDPTLYLAPFFVFFFGFCLTDAGYGIMLSALTIFALLFLPLRGEVKKLVQVVFYGGISTIILGALFGGWFGINLAEANGVVAEILRKIQIVDPLKSTMEVMYFVFLLGIIQAIAGISIKGYWNIKNNKKLDAALDQGLWIALLMSLLLFVLAKTEVIAGGTIMGKIVLAIMAALVLTQGRKAKNIFLKAGVGTVSLYGIVGYFSDMLSYSRLLALGLATGVIATVVNLIAGILGEMIPYVGFLVTLVILVGGHIFNLAINLLGAYIHSGRLQFVEFFPKFLEGGGQRFKPFRSEGKYVEVE